MSIPHSSALHDIWIGGDSSRRSWGTMSPKGSAMDFGMVSMDISTDYVTIMRNLVDR